MFFCLKAIAKHQAKNKRILKVPQRFAGKQQGFTLIEMITVIVLLGVISVGIASFFNFAAQTFVNSSERDQLIGSARFSLERLNREIRTALPNSVRVLNISGAHCLEFVPIVASSTYLNVSHSAPLDEIEVIEFNQQNQQAYDCTSCGDHLVIYPLSTTDVYVDPQQVSGQLFALSSVDKNISGDDDIWQLSLTNTVTVNQLSPTDRFYIVNQPVRFCEDNNELWRVAGYELSAQLTTDVYPAGNSRALMAENVTADFIVNEATLTRNSVVQVNLTFTRSSDSDESVTFNQEVHINNTP